MKALITLLCGGAGALLAVGALAAPGDKPSARQEREMTNSILMYIEHEQCDKAVKAMNEGLAQRMDDVMLMAGTMYEEGICLKKDWDQAEKYYQMASLAGNVAALPRRIAGLAYQQRDPAAALYWAADYNLMPLPCRAADGLRDNPDAFVAAIKAWPPDRLATCVYVAGVLHRIAGDIEHPGRAAVNDLEAGVVMRFAPATGTIAWFRARNPRVNGAETVKAADRAGAVYNGTFAGQLAQMGARALSQFQRPPSIDPSVKIDVLFTFRTEH